MAKLTTRYKGNMLFESQIGNHKLTIDVPPTMGGSDRGPIPPDLFVASLGSCIAAFVAQYCELNGIDNEGLSVDITYDKVDQPTRLANLKATINLPKGDCRARIEGIRRVAEHCPVHETITGMNGLGIEVLGLGQCEIQHT